MKSPSFTAHFFNEPHNQDPMLSAVRPSGRGVVATFGKRDVRMAPVSLHDDARRAMLMEG